MSAKTGFVIVSIMRTGSTMLADLLNRHEKIHCDLEVLGANPPQPHELLQRKMALHSEQIYGFLLKLGQIRSPAQPHSQHFVRQLYHAGWKIIYVRRLNLFHQAVSVELVRLRGHIYHDTTRSTTLPPLSVRFDAKRLLLIMEALEIGDILYRGIMAPLAPLSLVYEHDLRDAAQHSATACRVFALLGLPEAPVATDYRKTVPRSLPDFIENYAEVAAAVRATRFSHFLDGDDPT